MKAIIVAVMVLSCAPAYSQDGLSPKLGEWLRDHPAALNAISNLLSEAQLNRPVHIYYYYATERLHMPTMHRYLDGSTVLGIFVCENQLPCGECIDIAYELLNSKGEKRFVELWGQAQSGSISKQDFVKEMRRQEFQAVVAMQKLLSNFKLSDKDVAGSRSYKLFMESPSDFEKFLAFRNKAIQGQEDGYYGKQYDALRASGNGEQALPNQSLQRTGAPH